MSDAYDITKDRWPNNIIAPGQARRAYAVTPSDTLDLPTSSSTPFYAKALYIGVSGDVEVIMAGDNTSAAGTPVTFTAHPVGYLPCMVRRVTTATTATNIVALCD